MLIFLLIYDHVFNGSAKQKTINPQKCKWRMDKRHVTSPFLIMLFLLIVCFNSKGKLGTLFEQHY